MSFNVQSNDRSFMRFVMINPEHKSYQCPWQLPLNSIYLFFSPTNIELEEGKDSSSAANDVEIPDDSVVDWIRRVYDCGRSHELQDDGEHKENRKMIIRVRK